MWLPGCSGLFLCLSETLRRFARRLPSRFHDTSRVLSRKWFDSGALLGGPEAIFGRAIRSAPSYKRPLKGPAPGPKRTQPHRPWRRSRLGAHGRIIELSDATIAPAVAMPPEIAHYIRGAETENLQFQFLIGDWTVEGCRFTMSGDVLMRYSGTWRAQYMHGKRIVLDDFATQLPTGEEVSSFVTLRSYCSLTERWEMAGLGAFQPAMNGEWFGHLRGEEMVLQATARLTDGSVVRNRIRFHDIAPDQFRWESHNSFDDGESWVLAASMIVVRRA